MSELREELREKHALLEEARARVAEAKELLTEAVQFVDPGSDLSHDIGVWLRSPGVPHSDKEGRSGE